MDEEATEKKRKEAEEAARAKGEEGEVTVEPVRKASTSTEWDWKVQNDNKPLWTRSPKEARNLHAKTMSSFLYSGARSSLAAAGYEGYGPMSMSLFLHSLDLV